MGIKRYPEPTGGVTAPTFTGEGISQPNVAEGTFGTFVTGSISGMSAGQILYAADGTHKTLLQVVAVGADDAGYQTVEFSNPLSAGGTPFGTTTFYGGVGP